MSALEKLERHRILKMDALLLLGLHARLWAMRRCTG